MRLKKQTHPNPVLLKALDSLMAGYYPKCPKCGGFVASPPSVRTDDGTFHAACYTTEESQSHG